MYDSVVLPACVDPPKQLKHEDQTELVKISDMGSTPFLTNTLFSAYRTGVQRRATLLPPLHTLSTERPPSTVCELFEQDAIDCLQLHPLPLK